MIRGMNHQPFIVLVRELHRATKRRMDIIQKTVTGFTGGTGLSGGAYGETYEKVFVQICFERNLRIEVSPFGAVTDVYFHDYRAMLQIKTNQGGKKCFVYNGGKTKNKGGTRGEAVALYVERVEEQFNDVYEAAENFYLLSYNAKANTLDVYWLATTEGKKVAFIDDFIHQQAKGYDADARVGMQLEFSMCVLRKIYGNP